MAPRTTFLSLPAELRNEIYELSGCLEPEQYTSRKITSFYFGDCNLCRMLFMKLKRESANTTPRRVSVWINHNSDRSDKNTKRDQSLRTARSLCDRWPALFSRNTNSAIFHSGHISRLSQPALTQVSRQVREETLSIFYGTHTFLLTLFSPEIDGASLFQWLKTIGRHNAERLRELKVVYRKKADRRFLERVLVPGARRLGFGGEFSVKKLRYPFCYCEGCVRVAAGEMEEEKEEDL